MLDEHLWVFTHRNDGIEVRCFLVAKLGGVTSRTLPRSPSKSPFAFEQLAPTDLKPTTIQPGYTPTTSNHIPATLTSSRQPNGTRSTRFAWDSLDADFLAERDIDFSSSNFVENEGAHANDDIFDGELLAVSAFDLLPSEQPSATEPIPEDLRLDGDIEDMLAEYRTLVGGLCEDVQSHSHLYEPMPASSNQDGEPFVCNICFEPMTTDTNKSAADNTNTTPAPE